MQLGSRFPPSFSSSRRSSPPTLFRHPLPAPGLKIRWGFLRLRGPPPSASPQSRVMPLLFRSLAALPPSEPSTTSSSPSSAIPPSPADAAAARVVATTEARRCCCLPAGAGGVAVANGRAMTIVGNGEALSLPI